jgi:hypothetical protein
MGAAAKGRRAARDKPVGCGLADTWRRDDRLIRKNAGRHLIKAHPTFGAMF